ncbi:MAG: type I DNA topoisomerase [Actinomycetota bacterium]|nr:type I DNA topoisomerase [Actinomycetota bacterium]
MAKKLVVVESPTKANTIKKYLGRGYDVRASYGHVRDLPKSKMGVDLEGDLTPHYLVPKEKKQVVRDLRKAVKGAETIYLATDLDREGEAIAWHVAAAAQVPDDRIRRVVFSEITSGAVLEAFEAPRAIDQHLVDAQQARRVIDRLVGYTLSPVVSRWIRRGLSAGRVQSAALRLIVDREREIGAFVTQEYWSVHVHLLTPQSKERQQEPFIAHLVELEGHKLDKLELAGEEQVTPIVEDLERAGYRVDGVESKERRRHPAPPFTTSTLQQEAARKLGFSARRTMAVAQQLYQGIQLDEEQVGLITYMRTDSVNIADPALREVRAYVTDSYGKRYSLRAPRTFKTSSKRAQEAHEAIRPTSVLRTPDSVARHLERDQLRLYDLIWKRTVATQMAAALFEVVTATISARVDGRVYGLRASGQTLRFDGFLRLYQEGRDDESEAEEGVLPPLEEGMEPDLQEVRPEQHFTQPPPRFTEASLVKELESLGIGRPSTYAQIIGTLQDRRYVRLESRRFQPTELGERVTDALKRHFPEIVDVEFTARMEEDLDRIAAGDLRWKPLVRTFYDPFARLVEKKEAEVSRDDFMTQLDRSCPNCQRPLVERFGRFGKFIACSGYPDCDYSEDLRGPRPQPEPLDEECPKCGEGRLVRRVGRYGPFVGCERYPECRYIKKDRPPSTGAQCPDCREGELLQRRGRRGAFYGCSGYPKCRFTTSRLPLPDPCPRCRGLVTEQDGGAACSSCGLLVQEPSAAS